MTTTVRRRSRTAALLLASAACLVAVAARAQERVGTVAALEGRAEAQHAGGPQPAPLAAGDAVFLGDRVRTLEASRARLVLRDDSVLTLAPSSEMELTAQVVGPAAATTTLGVAAGAVRAIVPDRYGARGSKFQVETPTAVAGVRGTGFIVFYEPGAKRSRVVGLFHRTWVCGRRDANCRNEVVIGPQEITEVLEGGLPTRARRLTDAEFAGLTASTESVAGGLQPDAELGPARGTAATAAGDGYIDDPAKVQKPGDKAQTPEGTIVDAPLQHIERETQPGIPPIPPTKR